jgi:hypothetical protein
MVIKKTSHIALTLRGDKIFKGIKVNDYQVLFKPQWGMTRHNIGLIACSELYEGSLDKVYVGIMDLGVVLVPCEKSPQKELVLVQQYNPGSGAKRWPGFQVQFSDEEVYKLSEVSTLGGSGGEKWILVSAPLGWAKNIASQFINERDYDLQTISYNPDCNGRERQLALKYRELNQRFEKYEQELDYARQGRSDYIVLWFMQQKNPKTGEKQWARTIKQNGKNIKFVVNAYGQQPGSDDKWVCQKGRVLVDDRKFKVVVVDLKFRTKKLDEIADELHRINFELTCIRRRNK